MGASLIYSPMKGKNNMSKTRTSAPKGNSDGLHPQRQQKATRAQTSKTTKPRTPRKVIQILAPQEALQLLESAVSYCQQAGLQVRAANQDDGALAVFIPNAHYVLTDDGARAAFRLTAGATV
jgi:hypothetical protein